ncbi:daunorubicin resistance protein DrrA family ABC transporter ATP-binding protein [Nocardia neocaledoniensis NBRC 108232]|uniref:ABC-2 type transport system ATP-binding protein n=1 Tax=Nocardia neocaledoniensis TaxID=236511 RepID=A0A317N6B0_9NOCA|nr:ATP-binding cassette domain-containing protein [Nocardia neocaledoniensis]PWV70604.1 ABC-2 type transport system ATP-binding protein [Nocardia neocaledoniensis]GEM33934.1 daunorubicin resistance protein DrrA family ABC transporter ATP-binding protein [Nocardia neocaledoniensis NBRC 108232]
MPAIEVAALTKSYGRKTVVAGVDLRVPTGQVHALLGPNGSGKTTIVRMLATLTRPTSGRAAIRGFDTVRQADQAKRQLGLVGQFHAVDPRLSGRQNLVLLARLNGLRAPAARRRADELLERFDLAEAADRVTATYSGGMRRRLDIIAGMIVRPAVLFLDEPTTGLDPHSRNEIYRHLREFVAEGTTVLLTTQYLDEAQRLADAITILQAGRVIAAGTPEQILAAVPAGLEVVLDDPAHYAAAVAVLREFGGTPTEPTPPQRHSPIGVSFTFAGPDPGLLPVLRALDAAGILVRDIGSRVTTLDDAFLALTGGDRLSA